MAFVVGELAAPVSVDEAPFDKGLNSVKQKGESFAQGFSKNLKSVGTSMTKNVTLPILGIGAAALYTVAGFDDSMSKVSAISGSTGADLDKLRAQAKELGSQTRYSASEAADAMGYLALAGWDTNQILAATPNMLSLAAAAGMDLANAADIVSDTMSAFAMDANDAGKAADIFAAASSKSNTDVAQLGEAMKYAGAAANAAGMDLAQTSAVLGMLADAGMKGSMAGTTFTQMLADLRGASENGRIAVGKHTVELYDQAGAMRDMGAVMADVEKATADMTTQQRDAALGAIFGERSMRGANIMLETGADRYNELETAMYNSTGAAEKMADTMEDNIGGAMRAMKSQGEGILIQLGEQIAPLIRTTVIPLMQSFGDTLSNIIDWYSKLNPSTQKFILGSIATAAALGPVAVVGGSVVGNFAKLAPVLGGATKLLGGLKTGAAGASPALGGIGAAASGSIAPLLLIGGGLVAATAAGIALHRHMSQDAIPTVRKFGDAVSDGTQQALDGFYELHDEATTTLRKLEWSGGKISEDTANTITANYTAMADQVKEGLEKSRVDSLAAMQDLFRDTKDLTEAEQADMLERLNSSYDDRIATVEENEARIQEITQEALKNGGEMTEAHHKELNKIRKSMEDQAIYALSEGAEEMRAIREQLRRESESITARQAAEIVKQSIAERDGVVEEAEKLLRDKMKFIISLRDDTGEITAEEADMMIKNAERQYDETVQFAQDMHDEIIALAQDQAGEHVNLVDWATGEILSLYQIMVRGINTQLSKIKPIPTAHDANFDWNTTTTPSSGNSSTTAPRTSSAATGASSSSKYGFTNTQEFATGGRIPGPPGMPVPIIAHGGEEVVTYHDRMYNERNGGGGQTDHINVSGVVRHEGINNEGQLIAVVDQHIDMRIEDRLRRESR